MRKIEIFAIAPIVFGMAMIVLTMAFMGISATINAFHRDFWDGVYHVGIGVFAIWLTLSFLILSASSEDEGRYDDREN